MTHEPTTCRLCGHTPLERLPVPQPSQSMLSDGRIWLNPLRKTGCPSCGLVCHAVAAETDTSVREFYNTDYSLGAAPGTSDLLRNEAYAGFVADFASHGKIQRVLEIGSGSGQVLAYLADRFPEAEFVGLEAAEQLSRRQVDNAHVTIRHGFIEDLPPTADPYDFVYSINVIEHAADPVRFLKAVHCQLAPDGRALMICPAGRPPNLELLFQDHVSSFSHAAFGCLSIRAGLRVLTSFPHLEAFPGFQAFLLGKAGAADAREQNALRVEDQRLTGVATYLEGWQCLDSTLLSRIGGSPDTRIFGAGEMAALLRCYAPRFWHTVQAVVVDEAVGCRDLGLPVVPTHQLQPDSKPLVLAVHPRAQEALSERLRAVGFDVVKFDDVIPR